MVVRATGFLFLLILVTVLLQPSAQAWRQGLGCGIDVYFATGDSITVGSSSIILGQNGPNYVDYISIQPTYKRNGAVSGTGMNNAPTTEIDAYVGTRCNSANVVASQLFGFNDFTVGRTTAQFLTTVSNWADPRRAAGVKVICTTLLPSTDSSSPGYNAWRNTVNATLSTWGPGGSPQHCDGIADFAGNSLIGQDASPNDTLYYMDKIHLKVLGQQTAAPIMQAATRLLLH